VSSAATPVTPGVLSKAPRTPGEYEQEQERCRALVERRLNGFFTDVRESCRTLAESMKYSLLAGGKRIRPVLCIKFCEAAGGMAEDAIDAACAIEMLHTYSLIHDDLPCMDDDDLRRGMPSNHIRYGEFTATLAGDALQAAAFETLLSAPLPPGIIVEMAKTLAEAAGPRGICGGQYLDLAAEKGCLEQTGEQLEELYAMKTAALYVASARIGVLAAGGSAQQLMKAEEYAGAVGLAFQIRDDILDVVSTEAVLGKPIGSDSNKGKATFQSVIGMAECEAIIAAQTEKAIKAAGEAFEDSGFLAWLAADLAKRKY